jgi:hypothetical protein
MLTLRDFLLLHEIVQRSYIKHREEEIIALVDKLEHEIKKRAKNA